MSLSVHHAASSEPDRIALVAGGLEWSYGELSTRAAAAWRALAERGLGPGRGEPVALVASADVTTIVVLHALIGRGVPVHLLHPRLTLAERKRMVDTIRPALTIADPARYDPGSAPARAPGEAGQKAAVDAVPATPPDDDRTLAVVYTSGTSGASKGVVLSRSAFAAAARASAANLGWRDDDRWLLDLPLAHVGGLSVLTRCLLARRTVVLPRPEADVIERTITSVERDRVTLLSLVPTQLQRLMDRRPGWDPPPRVRAILLGGAPAPVPLLERAADRGWPILATYGLTECCSQVATQRPGTVNRGQLGAGPPLPGVEVRIRDGEIQVRTPALFSGYVGPGSRAPMLDDGWFPTGDRGTFDGNGNLHVLGRIDDVIISGGENVDPLEVEVALRSCPGVEDACVFGVPDDEWGQRVAAAVVGHGTDAAALDGRLRDRIAAFKLPRAYVFVDEIPVSRTGKPDRRAAARSFRSGLTSAS